MQDSAQLSSELESRTSRAVEKYPYERAVFAAPCRCRSTCTCIDPRAVDTPELRNLVRSALGVDARRFGISPVHDLFEHTVAVCVLGRSEMEAGALAEAVVEFGSERTEWKLMLDSEVDRIAIDRGLP